MCQTGTCICDRAFKRFWITICCEINFINCSRYWLSVGARPSKPVAILLGLVSWQQFRAPFFFPKENWIKSKSKWEKGKLKESTSLFKAQPLKWLHLDYVIKRIPCTWDCLPLPVPHVVVKLNIYRLDEHSSEWAILGEQEILAENLNRNITRNWETQKHFQEIAKEGQNHVFGNITHNFPKVRRMLWNFGMTSHTSQTIFVRSRVVTQSIKWTLAFPQNRKIQPR